MAIYLRNRHLEELARQISRETGESLTEAVTRALDERLERLRHRRNVDNLVSQIMAIARRCEALPDVSAPGGVELTRPAADGGR